MEMYVNINDSADRWRVYLWVGIPSYFGFVFVDVSQTGDAAAVTSTKTSLRFNCLFIFYSETHLRDRRMGGLGGDGGVESIPEVMG